MRAPLPARLTKREKSNFSRTLKTPERYGLVDLMKCLNMSFRSSHRRTGLPAANIKVVAAWAPQVIHVLDRFHGVAKLQKAVDEVRAKEARELAKDGQGELLKHTRWCLLKSPRNLTKFQAIKLATILRSNLRAARAYLLKDAFNLFWTYNSPRWAGRFLDLWCKRAMRSRVEPIQKFAQTLRAHRELLLNWFIAKKAISSGVVEALNANAKLAFRRARGFRSFKVLEIALYHYLGKLPEPPCPHRFR